MKSKKKYTILVVDDSQIDSMIVQKMLDRDDYIIIQSQTGTEAMKKLEESVPDLVILDVVLPDGLGYDFCKEMKDNLREKGGFLPVIMLTSLDCHEHKVAGLESGADDFIVKPPMEDELRARVQTLLQLRDLDEDLRTTNERLSHMNRIVERELLLIGEIQRSFLPQSFPKYSGIDIAARYQPSMQAGGDYYDVIPLDDRRWGLVMADIAGHGVSAAVVMALLQMTVREFVPGIQSPGEALKVINDKLNAHLSTEHFVTMFYAVLDLESMEFVYASAGHDPMLFYSAEVNEIRQLKTEFGFPLRTFETIQYDEMKERLCPGDKILLFTDGVVETINAENDFYGIERLSDFFKKNRVTSAKILVDKIFADTEEYRQDKERLDDFTLMVIGRHEIA